ncbi:MAG: DNA polymerase III subunit epsilon, partial [Paracoccaceae bacterium]|nr:DNA polymerase III subunit epsilon [Paracoccaceae bacterium]
EVSLELIGGRQPDLVLMPERNETKSIASDQTGWRPHQRPNPLPPRISDQEAAAHAVFVAKLGDGAIWLKRG